MTETSHLKKLVIFFQAKICFSTEDEEQLAITEINIYEEWQGELYKPMRESREFKRDRNQVITTRDMSKRNNKSSAKQVELSYLKEQIKHIKKW